MNKIFLIGVIGLSTVAFADSGAVVGNFKGVYLGPSLSFGKTHIGVSGQRYKRTQLKAGGLLGYGEVFSKDLYLGGEVGLSCDTFSLKQQGQKVEANTQLEGVFRFGQVIRSNFLPYVGLGLAHSGYKLKSSTANRNFHTTDLISELGVDAFVKPHIVIRSSFRYQRGLSAQAGFPVDVQKKTQSIFLKIGVSYIL